MFSNEDKLLDNIRRAETDDLLDRVTAYRHGMESEAVELIKRELYARGIAQAQIAEREEECQHTCIYRDDGTAVTCSFCRKPAIAAGWAWHKLWGRIPVFPRRFCFCRGHCKESRQH